MRFQTALDRCTPGLWSVRARSEKLDDPNGQPQRTTIPLPEDKNLAAEFARRGLQAGTYVVRLQAQQRGEDFEHERNRVRLKNRERIEEGRVVVSSSMAEAPPESRAPVAGVDAARADAERAKFEATSAEAAARKAEADARRKRLERAEPDGAPAWVQQLIASVLPMLKPADPAAGMAQMFQLLLKQQNDAAAAQAAMLQAMLARADSEKAQLVELLQLRQAPSGGEGEVLSGAARQVESVGLLLDLVERLGDRRPARGDGDGESILGLVRDLFAMHGGLPRPAAAAAAAPAAAPPMRALPAIPTPAADAATMARDRVREFVLALVRECTLGSDAKSVAGELWDGLGILPGNVRAPLLAGDWRGAWSGCRQHDPEQAAALEPHLEQPAAQEWLRVLAAEFAAINDEPEDETA